MPDQDDNNEGLQSSMQAETDVTEVTSAPAEDSGAAASSPAPDEKPEDMASVVRDVVAKSEEPAPSAEEDAKNDEGEAAPTEAKDDTDYSDVPFNKHPRFQQLLRKAKDYEIDAGRYRNIEGFLQQNSMTADEAANGLQILALAKSDPAKALEQIKPFVRQLLIASGEVLPDDLKTRVQTGEMPMEAAMEVSRSRATVAQQREAQRIADERRQRDEGEQRQTALVGAAAQWLQDRDARDPSFQAKYPLMEREVAFLQRSEGVPGTPEGVRDQLNRAYDAVNKQARAAAPTAAPRPAVRPVTGGAAPGKTTPQPTSMVEAIRAARGA